MLQLVTSITQKVLDSNLQEMLGLAETHPELHNNFVSFGYHTIRRTDRFWAGLWSDLVIEQVMMRSIKSAGGLTRGRGFSQSVRHQWTYTAHHCAPIHDSMTKLSNLNLASSDQHVEMTVARRSRDIEDCNKIYTWIKDRNPFAKTDKRLKSLSTGVTAGEGSGVNCDNAEPVGEKIQEKLDDVSLVEAKIKRKERVVCLDAALNTINVEKKLVKINPTLLFNRLSALAGKEENVEKYFGYELTTYPMSLFKEGMMRKPDKASLRNRILTKEMSSPSVVKKIIDGGALLHRIHWPPNCTYGNLVTHHVNSVRQLYGCCCVVFDGYGVASVKDQEHTRGDCENGDVSLCLLY